MKTEQSKKGVKNEDTRSKSEEGKEGKKKCADGTSSRRQRKTKDAH